MWKNITPLTTALLYYYIVYVLENTKWKYTPFLLGCILAGSVIWRYSLPVDYGRQGWKERLMFMCPPAISPLAHCCLLDIYMYIHTGQKRLQTTFSLVAVVVLHCHALLCFLCLFILCCPYSCPFGVCTQLRRIWSHPQPCGRHKLVGFPGDHNEIKST